MKYEILVKGTGVRGLGAVMQTKSIFGTKIYTLTHTEGFKHIPSMDIWINQKTGAYHYHDLWKGGRVYRARTEASNEI